MLITLFMISFFLSVILFIIYLVAVDYSILQNEKLNFSESPNRKRLDKSIERGLLIIKNKKNIEQTQREVMYYLNNDTLPFYVERKLGKIKLREQDDTIDLVFSSGCYQPNHSPIRIIMADGSSGFINSSECNTVNYSKIINYIPCDILKKVIIYNMQFRECRDFKESIFERHSVTTSKIESDDYFPRIFHIRLFTE